MIAGKICEWLSYESQAAMSVDKQGEELRIAAQIKSYTGLLSGIQENW
jgi:hypothetical protein